MELKKVLKNIRPTYHDLAELIEKYNPFGYKDERSRICIFATYEEVYYETCKRLFKLGGPYVDLVQFCVENFAMPVRDAERFIAEWKHLSLPKGEFVYLDWSGEDGKLTQTLEAICKGLHGLSGTRLNKDMLLGAIYRFQKDYVNKREVTEKYR